MARLVFLTGAPGSGKSTLARRLADERPLSLLLDIDTLRGQLGGWERDPDTAGRTARRLALALARTHLESGADVIVPQFVRRPDLIREFRRATTETGGTFVLVALVSSAAEAAERFRARGASTDANHVAAARLQSASGALPIEQLYAEMIEMLAAFPETRYVESLPGEIELTLTSLRDAVEASGPE